MRRLTSPAPVLFACLFASQAGMLVLSPILPEIAREFGVSNATAGQLRSISGAVGGLVALLLAVAPRRPGMRDMLAAGAALLAAGSALSAAAPSFTVLAVAQGVIGAGVGVLVAVGIAAAGEWPSAAERARVLAWAIVGMPAAWVTGMPVVGALADAGWRAAFVGVPAVAGLVALALVLGRPADPRTARIPGAAGTWRRPAVARFAGGELLSNAAWAAILTYSGVLLLESYDITPAVVALGLAAVAVAMFPGTWAGKRFAAHASAALLTRLSLFQAVATIALYEMRPSVAVTLGVMCLMAFVNGWRSMVASTIGMDTAPEDKVAVMSVRAAANQFGYLIGAATGGLALAVGGFSALGVAMCALFVASVIVHDAMTVQVARVLRLSPAR